MHSVSRLVKELLTKMLGEVTSISKWWGGATRPTKMKPKIPGSQLKLLYIKQYEDSENMKAKRVNTVVFNSHQIKQMNFYGTHESHSRSRLMFVFFYHI